MKKISLSLALAAILLAAASGGASADIVDDAVFAYDFENISGANITALRGSNGTLVGSFAANGSNNLPFSGQNVRAPLNNSFGGVETNALLNSPIAEMSFSTMFNANGDNGSDSGSNNLVRFLSSYDGANAVNANESFFDMFGAGSQRNLRLGFGSQSVTSASFNLDANSWQHVGFSLASSGGNTSVQFYLNGNELGAAQEITGLAQIIAQNSSWHLFEDTTAGTDSQEYFDGGDYDESALWYRQLSSAEFSDIAANGLAANAIPEPASAGLLLIGALGLCVYRRK